MVHVRGEASNVRRFLTNCGRRRGLRTALTAAGATLSIDADRVETIGPFIEATALVSEVELWLADLNAVIESAGLDGRMSRVWAAIGNAADEREIARSKGTQPAVPLLAYVRAEESGERIVARDARPPLADPEGSVPPDFSPIKFDDADWHTAAARKAGHPAEHGWTHIALFLTWLIRSGLSVDEAIGQRRTRAVRVGAVVGRDLMNHVDGKLLSTFMTDEAAVFAQACYEAYLGVYDRLSGGYTLPADAEAFDIVAPQIDQLWQAWKASGR